MDIDPMKGSLAKAAAVSGGCSFGDADDGAEGKEQTTFSPDGSKPDKGAVEKPNLTSKSVQQSTLPESASGQSEFIRAENEDDDGYDPYSDRRPEIEPLFERDPWS